MNPINVGIITGALVFIVLLQASILTNPGQPADMSRISLAAWFVGAMSAVLEIVWPGTMKQKSGRDGEDEETEELQESLDEFERTE
jgi:hypothetical protein